MKRIIRFVSASGYAFPSLLAAVIGILTGGLAVVFIKAIAWIQSVCFVQGAHGLSFFGSYYVVLIPALGGLFVGPLVTFLAPEAKGHGVPEVLKAIALRGGRIRPLVVVAKALSSAIAIGSGSSVGREGPIVQAGAALGSTLGQVFKMSEFRIKNFLACGTAAGISAVFNAPIAGVMFASEVILRDFGARALTTIVISSVSASVVSRIFLGESPAFAIPVYHLTVPHEIFLYPLLGILAGLAAHLFMQVLGFSETCFDRWKFPAWAKPVIGGLGIGVIGFFVPQVFGAGLDAIAEMLRGNFSLSLLVALIFLKIIATSLSLGSGSSGGVFAPALFIGAALGGAFGMFVHVLPFPISPSGAYALVGMASVFAAAAHAPVTAILIVFEMTSDYLIILPLMLSVVVATAVSQWIRRDSIYTMKLSQKGIHLGFLGEAKVLGAIQVRDAMSTDFEILPEHMPVNELLNKASQDTNTTYFVANDNGVPNGMIKPEDFQIIFVESSLQGIIVNDMATPLSEVCFPEEPLSEVARQMAANGMSVMPVADPHDVKHIMGILRTENIFRSYANLVTKHSELIGRIEQDAVQAPVQTQFIISSRSALIGKCVREIELPAGVVLTFLRRGRKAVVPKGDTQLYARDKIFASYTPEHKEAFRQWLQTQNQK